MRRLFILSLVWVGYLSAQPQAINFRAPSPPSVTNVSVSVTVGQRVGVTYYFWVVANYPIGKSNPVLGILANGPATLDGTHVARIAWNDPNGATPTSYDILRTPTPTLPSGNCTCGALLGAFGQPVDVAGLGLQAYTIGPTVPPATGIIYLDNINNASPQFVTNPVIAGGTGTPGGVNGSVQFNNSGILGGLTLGRDQTIFGTATNPVAILQSKYVQDYGCDITGATDCSPQVQAAINSCSTLAPYGCEVVLPAGGLAKLNSQITIAQDRVYVTCAGKYGGVWDFEPTGSTAIVQRAFVWDKGAVITQGGMKGCGFISLDTTHKKVAITPIAIAQPVFRDIAVISWSGHGTGGALTGSRGFEIYGHQGGEYSNIETTADDSNFLAFDPYVPSISLDHTVFNNWIVTTNANNPCWEIGTGTYLTNVTWSGYQAMETCAHGVFWNDTTSTAISADVEFGHMRAEGQVPVTGTVTVTGGTTVTKTAGGAFDPSNPIRTITIAGVVYVVASVSSATVLTLASAATNGAGQAFSSVGYELWIHHNYNIDHLRITDSRAGIGTTINGISLRKVLYPSLNGILYSGSGVTANVGLDLDNTVNHLNCTGISLPAGTTNNINALDMNCSYTIGGNSYNQVANPSMTSPATINSGLTPTQGQLNITAGGLGALSSITYAPDNEQIGFDVDFVGGTFIARNATVGNVAKVGGHLLLRGSGGNTSGISAALTPWFDLNLTNGALSFLAPATTGLTQCAHFDSAGVLTGTGSDCGSGGGGGLTTTVTIDFSGAAVNDGACSAFVTGRPFTGVTSGQPINLSMATAANQLKGYQFFAVGDGANTFKAQWCNLSGGAITLASQSFNAAAGGGAGISGLAFISNGTPVATESSVDFINGTGVNMVLADVPGTKVTVQPVIDPVVLVTNANLQAGTPLLGTSSSASGTTYNCTTNPVFGSYTTGMVINWYPDVNGTGGATTLNCNALGAKPVKSGASCSVNPTSVDIVALNMKQVWYNGTNMCFLATVATTNTPLQTMWDPWGFNVGGSSETEVVANRVHYYSLPVDSPGRVLSKLVAYTGSTALRDAGAIAWAIYDSTCTKLTNGNTNTQAGTSTAGGTLLTWTFPATLTLTAGQYFIGWSSDNTGTGFYGSYRGAYITDLLTSSASTYVFYGANASTTVATVTTLPTTCGAHTSPGSFAGNFFPGIVMY